MKFYREVIECFPYFLSEFFPPSVFRYLMTADGANNDCSMRWNNNKNMNVDSLRKDINTWMHSCVSEYYILFQILRLILIVFWWSDYWTEAESFALRCNHSQSLSGCLFTMRLRGGNYIGIRYHFT